jgi:hypothetical protein
LSGILRIATEPSAEQLLDIGDGLRHSVENRFGAVEVVMLGHMGWQCQAAYSRTVSCLQTMLRVFNREAVRAMQAKPLKGQDVAVWRWFARANIVSGDYRREVPLEIVRTKRCVDSVPACSRDHREFQAGATKLGDGSTNAVHEWEGALQQKLFGGRMLRVSE